nr:P-loop containing nucleoside triphosphate hydrolase protein [Ipomoea batatas]
MISKWSLGACWLSCRKRCGGSWGASGAAPLDRGCYGLGPQAPRPVPLRRLRFVGHPITMQDLEHATFSEQALAGPCTGSVPLGIGKLNLGLLLLLIGPPGVGKTTIIRDIARMLANDYGKRVMIVDTSNEIGGDGDIKGKTSCRNWVNAISHVFISFVVFILWSAAFLLKSLEGLRE